MHRPRHAVTSAVLGLLLTLVSAAGLAGCSSGSDTGGSAGNGTVKTIRVSVKDGKVTPQAHREKVDKGDTVKLVVTTDTADEVHVHGVDIEKPTEPGKPTTLQFVVKDAGVYEAETHESGLQLLQLEVR